MVHTVLSTMSPKPEQLCQHSTPQANPEIEVRNRCAFVLPGYSCIHRFPAKSILHVFVVVAPPPPQPPVQNCPYSFPLSPKCTQLGPVTFCVTSRRVRPRVSGKQINKYTQTIVVITPKIPNTPVPRRSSRGGKMTVVIRAKMPLLVPTMGAPKGSTCSGKTSLRITPNSVPGPTSNPVTKTNSGTKHQMLDTYPAWIPA
mmetsp:Transcript_86327/g.143612  ORF Transcript_86327/g.143612 Transcript_86327/m.143612 type:complete len:200 (+) Transcript_86327:504-1103(+)